MPSILRAAAALVLLASAALAGEVRTTLTLSGLSCVTCSAAVTKALKQMTGVRAVEVSEDRRHATVIADDSVPSEALTEALRRLGYGAEVVTP